MAPNDPPPLDYRPAGSADRPPREPQGLEFLLGLAIGTLASFLIWVTGWDRIGSFLPLAIVPGVKIAAAVALIASRKGRGAGAGVLTSIPLGALIFGWSFVNHCRI